MGFMKGPLASEGRTGMIQLASAEEAAAGIDNTKAITPATLKIVAKNTLQAFAPYIQSAAVRDFNEQEVVDAADLLAATGDLHALNLDLSANHSLQKLTAKGTSGKIANVSSVLVSNKAPLDNVTSPQIDVSYTGLNKAALVNLFSSMPYNVGYTTEGSPTITDGVASGFSDSDYLNIAYTPFSNSNLVEMRIKFTPTEIVTGYVFGVRINNISGGIYLSAVNNTLRYGMVMKSGNVGIPQAQVGSAGAISTLNVPYYLHFYFNPTTLEYKLGLSTDGLNPTYGITGTSAGVPPINQFQFGVNLGYSGFYFRGSVDLNETYIKVNGKPFFRGTAAMTKTVSVVGCSGTADLTAEDKAIAEDKGWAITLS